MKTETEIRQQLAILKARMDADREGTYEWPDERDEEGPDWTDTSNYMSALKWVLGEGEEVEL